MRETFHHKLDALYQIADQARIGYGTGRIKDAVAITEFKNTMTPKLIMELVQIINIAYKMRMATNNRVDFFECNTDTCNCGCMF